MSSATGKDEGSDPDWAKSFRKSKSVVYYHENIDHKITPNFRTLLENYSKVPAADISKHVHEMRDKAWAIRSYPCTGLGNFTTPMLPLSPAYSFFLKRLEAGNTFLDIGCFIGHDLRQLVLDGAPSDHLYGTDIANHWDVGFEMFRDKDRFGSKFIETDILDPNDELKSLYGYFDVISISLVLHQWSWDIQIKALKQVVKLSKKKATIVGFTVGNKPAYEQPNTNYGGKPSYWHDIDSFQRIWDQVGKETGTNWLSEAQYRRWEEVGYKQDEIAYLGKNARMLQFVVSRID